MDILQRFVGYINCRNEYSYSSARRVSNFHGKVPQGVTTVVLQCIGNRQCYATLKSLRTDIQTYMQTDRQTHITNTLNKI